MSATATHIGGYEAITAEGPHERPRRTRANPPDLLEKLYFAGRQCVPLFAIVSVWALPRRGGLDPLTYLMTKPFTAHHVLIVIALMIAWTCVSAPLKRAGRNTRRLQFIRSQLLVIVLGTAACTAILWAGRVLLRQPGLRELSLGGFGLRCGAAGVAWVFIAACLYSVAYWLSTPQLYLILGTRKRAIAAYKKLESQGDRPGRVLGFLDSDGSHAKYLPADYLGGIEKLESILVHQPVDMVYLALPLRSQYETLQEAIRTCERVGVEYSFSPDVFETRMARAERTRLTAVRGFVYHVADEDYEVLLKRMMDVAGSLVLLVLTAPLMLLIALAIKLTSRGPVLFTQERYGRNRRPFRIFKFRSMVDNAEELMQQLEDQNEARGPIFKIRKDPRITTLGGLLRRSSLDELPQLFNVLRGEMSLVGPRPMSFRDVHRFAESSLMRRFSVTPGITGLWQVSGRSNTDFDIWITLDLRYIDQWSLALDFKILLRTIPAVLTGSGAV